MLQADTPSRKSSEGCGKAVIGWLYASIREDLRGRRASKPPDWTLCSDHVLDSFERNHAGLEMGGFGREIFCVGLSPSWDRLEDLHMLLLDSMDSLYDWLAVCSAGFRVARSKSLLEGATLASSVVSVARVKALADC